jgi:glutathione S-transferase
MEEIKLKLFIHRMCPFAQRALFIWSFKNIQGELVECDLINKPGELTNTNPLGKVPTLVILRNGIKYSIYESLIVSDYLDTLPGPSLYPQINSIRDPIAKSIIDLFIKSHITPLESLLFTFVFRKNTPRDLQRLIKQVSILDQALSDDRFLLSSKLSYESVTFADVMLYPLMERIYTMKLISSPLSELDNFSNLWRWYDRMSDFSWISSNKAPSSRLLNYFSRLAKGQKGLRLPLSHYDDHDLKPHL